MNAKSTNSSHVEGSPTFPVMRYDLDCLIIEHFGCMSVENAENLPS
jgi:hypothetical protein